MTTREAKTGDWFYLLFIAVTFIPRMIWSGYVATRLWTWFLVPLGLPVINIPFALGLTTTLALITGSSAIQTTLLDVPKKVAAEDESNWDRYSKQISGWLVPAFMLLEGWILTHWL